MKLEGAPPAQKYDQPMSSSQQVAHKVMMANVQLPNMSDGDEYLNGKKLAGKCASVISSPDSLTGNVMMLSDGLKNSDSGSESECSEMDLRLSVNSDSDSYSWSKRRRKEYKSSSLLDPHAKRTKRAKERWRNQKEITKLERRLENRIHLSRCQRSKVMKQLRLLRRKRSGRRTKHAAKKRNQHSKLSQK